MKTESKGRGRGKRDTPPDDLDLLEEEADLLGDGEELPGRDAPGFFPELLRRGLTLGFTGVFMTEEAVRRALGDSVPRDVIEFVLEQSERTRADFLDRLSREFGRVLNSLDPVEIAKRLLEGRTVEVSAQFRLVPEERDPGSDDDG